MRRRSTDLLVDVFLVLGVACQLVCCLGVLVFGDVFDRLHFSGAGTIFGPLLIGAAVLLRQTTSAAGITTMIQPSGRTRGGEEFRGVDELNLHGGGRALPVLGLAFALAGFGLVGFPYVGTFLGHSLLDDGAMQHGHPWIPPLLMVATGISTGATATSVGYGIGATALAVAVALFGLFRQRSPEAVRAFGTRYLDPAVDGLKSVHTGIAGDYVMWITVGTARRGVGADADRRPVNRATRGRRMPRLARARGAHASSGERRPEQLRE